MINAVHNKTVGSADAGLQARALISARAFPEGVSLPTLRQLRS